MIYTQAPSEPVAALAFSFVLVAGSMLDGTQAAAFGALCWQADLWLPVRVSISFN